MFGTLRVELSVEKLVKAGFLRVTEDGEVKWPEKRKEGLGFDFSLTGTPSTYKDYDNLDPAIQTHLEEDFQGFATKYSWYGPIPSSPERAMGIYSSERATAYLDASGKNDVLKLIIYADTFQALREIYFSIRRGDIKPGPGVNWSEQQTQ